MIETWLITGGAGFIGSHFVHMAIALGHKVINLDKLTGAGHLDNLIDLHGHPRHQLIRGDLSDTQLVGQLMQAHQPRAVVHFAAETHVDRSILEPRAFVDTNVLGTFHLLACGRQYWLSQPSREQSLFRFVHVSTDEVYGSLGPEEAAFTEQHPYRPNNPYAASKAASDHLVRAWHHTYGLPVLTTHSSNNYGPRQHPEKLIPLVVHHALAGKPLPIYGDGLQQRDWLYVQDHCHAIARVLQDGQPGATYNIGGSCEQTNLFVVQTITRLLDELKPKADGTSYAQQITFVKDRPGHDRRYALDAHKIRQDLDWRAQESFESGLRKTLGWYLDHPTWVDKVTSHADRTRMDIQYAQRLTGKTT